MQCYKSVYKDFPFKCNECNAIKNIELKKTACIKCEHLLTKYWNLSRMFSLLLNQLIAFDDCRAHTNRALRVFSEMPDDFGGNLGLAG